MPAISFPTLVDEDYGKQHMALRHVVVPNHRFVYHVPHPTNLHIGAYDIAHIVDNYDRTQWQPQLDYEDYIIDLAEKEIQKKKIFKWGIERKNNSTTKSNNK